MPDNTPPEQLQPTAPRPAAPEPLQPTALELAFARRGIKERQRQEEARELQNEANRALIRLANIAVPHFSDLKPDLQEVEWERLKGNIEKYIARHRTRRPKK